MNTTKIVVSKMQRNRSAEIRQFFAERIRQARESSVRHSQGQVLSFDKASADVARIGIAGDDSGLVFARFCAGGQTNSVPSRLAFCRAQLIDWSRRQYGAELK